MVIHWTRTKIWSNQRCYRTRFSDLQWKYRKTFEVCRIRVFTIPVHILFLLYIPDVVHDTQFTSIGWYGDRSIFQSHKSERFLFRKVLFQRGTILKFCFTSKGRYSENFYPEGSLFRRFISRRIIIQNFGITTLRDKKNLRNNNPSG